MSSQVSKEQGTMTQEQTSTTVRPGKAKPRLLPPFKVILHNDDQNSMEDVAAAILELTPLKKEEAILRMLEAHETGCALLLVTHKERAELYAEQFHSKSLTVTIEPAE
ncbi:MAG TPA: ATP-dependent Clp protease adaptor ClpS [Phycisphaerae bacterium]|nr:ATP-dependent Clp protease adaptor ClpS [Phycisphaerae bacterium]